MIASAHVAAGALVGAAVLRMRAPTPVRLLVAAAVGIAGHLAMDAIPHSDYAFIRFDLTAWVGLAEALVACGLVAFVSHGRLAPGQWIPLVTGVVSSMAPDIKFVARVVALQYEAPITRVTDAVHGFHATEPLHVWLAFTGEVLLAVGFSYGFWRLIRAAVGPTPVPGTAAGRPPAAS